MTQQELDETGRFIMDVLSIHYALWLKQMDATDNIIMHRSWWAAWREMPIKAQITYLNEIMHCALLAADMSPCKTMTVGFDLLAVVLLKVATRIVRYELASMSKVGRQNTIFAE